MERYVHTSGFGFSHCWRTNSTIAHMNGVFTTHFGANESLKELRKTFGEKGNETTLKYVLLYNQTRCTDDSKLSCLADLAEVFSQRQQKMENALYNRWEIFWESISGRSESQGSSTAELLISFGQLLVDARAAIQNRMLALTTSLAGRSDTEADTKAHEESLRTHSTNSNDSVVVVAHSQGNLFSDPIAKRCKKICIAPDNPRLHRAAS